ncbi:MAG: acyl carrier protein [Clostridium sp.]|nr:acyl carrier protein [Acetatifactor muris]MCM1528086.1 acyl carrier protein [Bacteroides sp.]MCM1562131.1 acyl carrier protein [Clostridium sp.]
MLDKIKEIVADSLGVDRDTLTADTSFKEDLNADSLDLFELVMALEEAMGVEIPSEELPNIQTLGDVEKYLSEQSA